MDVSVCDQASSYAFVLYGIFPAKNRGILLPKYHFIMANIHCYLEMRIVDEYYEDHEIAALLGITVGRLRNKICACDPLPPRLELPGVRHRIWPKAEVHMWLTQFNVERNIQRSGSLRSIK